MTEQVLFIQGGGEGVHDTWDDKLVASLRRELGANYAMRYPRMPNEADPNYLAWSSAIENELESLNHGAILVGHSIGGTILINTLAARKLLRKPRAVVLAAAPFVGPRGWPSDDIAPIEDIGSRLPPGMDVYIFHGSADQTAPPFHADLYAKAIPQARVRKLEGRDHQLNNDLREVAAAIQTLESAS